MEDIDVGRVGGGVKNQSLGKLFLASLSSFPSCLPPTINLDLQTQPTPSFQASEPSTYSDSETNKQKKLCGESSKQLGISFARIFQINKTPRSSGHV